MRKFSSLEKEILEKLVNSRALNEQGLLLCSKFLEDNYVGQAFELSLMVSSTKRKVFIVIPSNKSNYEEFQREKLIFIITFFNLIEELKAERKIYLIGDGRGDVILGPQFDNKITLAQDIDNIICDSFFKLITVTEELRELVRNNFQSLDEIHHIQNIEIANQSLKEAKQSVVLSEESLKESKRSVRKASYTIYTSVILALISMFSAFYIANKQAENEIKIDKNQYENVISKVDSLSKLLENMGLQMNKYIISDTIKTIVTKPVEIKKDKNH
jgi:hypothetical protein